MADESFQEKEHKPTGKRLGELHKKGTVMRSRDFAGGVLFIAAFMELYYFSSRFKLRLEDNFITAFKSIRYVLFNHDQIFHILSKMVVDNILLILPNLCSLVVIVLFTPVIFGGWNFTLHPLKFSFSKFNVVHNLMNMFSMKMFVDIGKSMLKAFFIIGALIFFISHNQNSILNLMNLSSTNAINGGFTLIVEFLVVICILVMVIAGIDMGYTYYTYTKQIKMTTQEVKDESKDAEGSPMVKQKIRSKQYALLKQRLMKSVPRANVIVTNPTHYAIALRYDDSKDKAPKVIAKGKDLIAQQIRLIAISNAVPIYEAPLLARAIYFSTQIGYEIPPGLYKAVAIVLTYVQQLKNYQLGKGIVPQYVRDLEIPEELIYDE